MKVDFQKFFFTADDWGLSKATNDAILSLVRKRVIRCVSVLSTFEFARYRLDELVNQPEVALGLHFNLTDLEKRRSPQSLLLRWMSKDQMFHEWVRGRFREQIHALSQMSIRPQYLDGHEHLHLLPGLIRSIATDCHNAGIQRIRLPIDWSLVSRVQAPILPLALLAKKEVRRCGFGSLPFAYPSAKDFRSREALMKYLESKEGYEIITHPAENLDEALRAFDHRFLEERVLQYQVLSSF